MGKIYKGSTLIMESGTGVTVDDELSTTSENPVQNKVITLALEEGLVLHSATEPATPEDGMLWYDETNKVLKIYSETDTEWKELGEGGVTSINGNTGDITMSTGKITLTQNGEEAGHFFLDQTIDKTIELKGLDKSWKNKTVSNGELELGIRTICYPSADFTLIKPTELVDGEEYVVRFINGSTPFNMTLGHGFTNPFGVDLTLSGDAKDQFTFLAIEGILELQPAPVLVAPVENPQAPTGLEATVSGTTGTIKWTDPLDAGTNIWLNTKLVRKAGSEPTSLSDGTVVVTVTTRNQYQSTGYDDSGLTAGTTYYYRAFAEFDEGEILGSAAVDITVGLPTESISFKIKANSSGDLKIPVAGYSTSGSQDVSYNWNVSVDGGTATAYTGRGSSRNRTITVATGLTAGGEYTVLITPNTEAYGWARAFGFYNSGIANLLTEVIYDGSYMGYAESATYTGYNFRAHQYQGTNINNAPAEVLPDTVTTIGEGFRAQQYMGSKITSAPDDVCPDSVTFIGNYFRSQQYCNCTSLVTTGIEALSSSLGGQGENESFRTNQFAGCTNLTTISGIRATTKTGAKGSNYRANQFRDAGNTTTPMNVTINGTIMETGATNSLGLVNANVAHVYVDSTLVTAYQGSADWSNIDDVKFGPIPGPTPPAPTPGAYTYSQIIDDAYATNGWGHIMSAELNTNPDVYFASLQASGNLVQQGSVYYITHDPTSITGNDVITGYEIFYNPSHQQWIMQMRDMTYDQIVNQATIQGTFNGLLPLLKTNASTYYTNLTNSGNMVEVQNPGSKFYMCADGTSATITEIGGEKVYYTPELGDWEIEANYGNWTYDQIIAKATADGNFYWTMMEMNRAANGYLIDLTQSGHIYQVGDNYWLSADGTTAYNLNGTVLRYQGTFDEWSIGAA